MTELIQALRASILSLRLPVIDCLSSGDLKDPPRLPDSLCSVGLLSSRVGHGIGGMDIQEIHVLNIQENITHVRQSQMYQNFLLNLDGKEFIYF